VESEPIDGQPCQFRTTYPVTLWPLEVKAASFKGHPFQAPQTRFSQQAEAVIRIELQCHSEKLTVNQLTFDQLRFFLRGPHAYMGSLYELIFNNTLGIAIADPAASGPPLLLPKSALRHVGFEAHESLLGTDPRSFWGYQLLSEYFSFPEKFMFFDLKEIPAAARPASNRLAIFLYLNRHLTDLERHVSADTFQLGCTPIVNLFSRRAESIQLTETQVEYHVVPDSRRPRAHEVYSIDRVEGRTELARTLFQPFYSVRHEESDADPSAFWYATRRRANYVGGEVDKGSETFLTFVNLDFTPAQSPDISVDVEVTCTNRDLPERLPFGGGQPKLTLGVAGPITTVSCLTAPTATLRPQFRHGVLWQLISHLSLNQLSLTEDEKGVDAFRDMLRLYDRTDSEGARRLIEGLLSIKSRRVVGRVPGGTNAVSGGFCRGVEVELLFDEDRYVESGLFLFACVLERFLGEYCSINSFTKMIAYSNKRSESPLRRWPPRASQRTLV
jgi:type VI secretion system protein ImpG